MYSQTFSNQTSVVISQATHGFAGNIIAALYTTTGEVMEGAIQVSGALQVTASFAVPTSGIIVITGGTGTGYYSTSLSSSPQVIPAATHGINHQRIIGACYDASGLAFECQIKVDPSNFEVTVSMTPFASSTIVLQGR